MKEKSRKGHLSSKARVLWPTKTEALMMAGG